MNDHVLIMMRDEEEYRNFKDNVWTKQ